MSFILDNIHYRQGHTLWGQGWEQATHIQQSHIKIQHKFFLKAFLSYFSHTCSSMFFILYYYYF